MYYTCSICMKGFITPLECQNHETLCEGDFFNELCDICGHVLHDHTEPCRGGESNERSQDHIAEFTEKNTYPCGRCSVSFDNKLDSELHQLFIHGDLGGTPCKVCGVNVSEKILRRHEASCGKMYKCIKCGGEFQNEEIGMRHEEVCGYVQNKINRNEPSKNSLLSKIPDSEGMNEYETAFDNRLKSYFLRCSEATDLLVFLSLCKTRIISTIQKQLEYHSALKVNIMVECTFVNVAGDKMDRAFKTASAPIFRDSDLDCLLLHKFKKIITEMEESTLKKSGWSLSKIDGLRLKINKYNPLRGSSYIPLPPVIEGKLACINVQNNDKKCFIYSMLAKYVSRNACRVSKYKALLDKYDFSCISYPTPLNEIKRFEKINGVSVNVFGIESERIIHPLKVVDKELADHTDLLLLDDGEKTHYVYIKNFSRLVGSQYNKREHKMLICKRCFMHFDNRYGETAEEKLSNHNRLCSQHKIAKIEMPLKNPILKFKNIERVLKLPFVIYADFESILAPLSTSQPDPSTSYTMSCQIHLPMSYSMYVKSSIENAALPKEPIVYRGSDAAAKFLSQLIELAKEIGKIYDLNNPMKNLTEEESRRHSQANKCYLCKKQFTEEDGKIFEHCHITGQYRGPAHNSCNLKCKMPNYIPVFIHNLSGYDAHYIVKELGCDSSRVEVIANTEEKYISFTKYVGKFKLRFIDTFRFMPSSLEKLVKNLPNFPETTKYFGSENAELVSRKGIFPYDYVDSWEKLEDKKLPSKEQFYSTLNESKINEQDYEHAQKVWRHFKIKNLGEYSDLYLITDVLLLADVFEAFRESTLRTHAVDPAHYFTSPSLTWDAMLKYTEVELELLQDYEQFLMIESGIRGGICQVSHRFAEANNKYTPGYDEKKPSQFITYEDANNQYGWAMCHYLPYGGFEFVDPETIDLLKLNEDDPIGYILEVSVRYPENLHQLHSDLPFLAEAITPLNSAFKN